MTLPRTVNFTYMYMYLAGGSESACSFQLSFQLQMGTLSLPSPAYDLDLPQRRAGRAFANCVSFVGGDHRDGTGAMSYTEWYESPLLCASASYKIRASSPATKSGRVLQHGQSEVHHAGPGARMRELMEGFESGLGELTQAIVYMYKTLPWLAIIGW